MSKRAPRLYLFHGSDTEASLQEMLRWRAVFTQKYGNASQYVFHGDEQKYEDFIKSITNVLQTRGLFNEPRLIVVRRISKIGSPSQVASFLSMLSSQLVGLGDTTTVVCWEAALLSQTSGIMKWFSERQLKDQAEIKQFVLPQGRELIQRTLQQHEVRVTREAGRWLEQYLSAMERMQRVAGKVRSADQLSVDWRRASLSNLIAAASLLALPEESLTPELLEAAAGIAEEAVSPFEIVNAVQAGQWRLARTRHQAWKDADLAAYFGLLALLRGTISRSSHSALRTYAQQQLAEIEIITKNTGVAPGWLLELFLLRCETFSGNDIPLIKPKRLWLSHIQRVG